MIHFGNPEDASLAFMVLIGAGCVLCIVIADHPEIGRRFNQGARLLAKAGPTLAAWLARKARGEFASPSRAHPAARALPCDCDACAAELSPADFAEWERDVRAGRRS